MEKALKIMNEFVDKVNEFRANGKYSNANDYLDMLCGAICIFNEYEAVNGRVMLIGETNNKIWLQVGEV